MKNISSITELQEAIRFLETRQVQEEALLKAQFKISTQKISPIVIIKNILDELTAMPNLKGEPLENAISMLAGQLSKELIIGETEDPMKHIYGSLIQIGVTHIVSNNTDSIKSMGSTLLKSILSKTEDQD